MDLTIQAPAKEYILEKGGSVHFLAYRKSSMCCGKVGFPPTVRAGIPKNKEEYEVHRLDGVDLYLPKDFCTKTPLMIGLQKTLGIRSLHVEGWNLI